MRPMTRMIAGGCLILGPAVQAVESFFWKDDYQGITSGSLAVIAAVCWITGLFAVFRLLEERAPGYAAVALPLAVYGCIGGVTFGVQGMHEELFGVPHAESVQMIGEHPQAAFAAFWIAGPLFPLGVFALGCVLARVKVVPLPTGVLMCVAALVFPLSRVPDEVAVAHLGDVLLLLPFVHLGVLVATGARGHEPAPVR